MARNLSVTATFLSRLFTTFGAYRAHDHHFKQYCPQTYLAAELTEKDKYFTVYPPVEEEDTLREFVSLGDSALRVSGVEDAAEIAAKAAETTTKAAMKVAKVTSRFGSKAVSNAARTARGKKDMHMGKDEIAKLQKERYRRLGWQELTWRDLFAIVQELEA